jgi:hypothetical protein
MRSARAIGVAASVAALVVVRQEPVLVQDSWSWEELRGDALQRRFAVDLLPGDANARAAPARP